MFRKIFLLNKRGFLQKKDNFSSGFLLSPLLLIPLFLVIISGLLIKSIQGNFLVIDLPPGTGDAQISLSQSVPISGAIVVTTPQQVSLQDARRGLAMFKQLGVPILGIVENMSVFIPPDMPSKKYEIFGRVVDKH